MNSNQQRDILIRKYIQNECNSEELSKLITLIREDPDFILPDTEELEKFVFSSSQGHKISSLEKERLYYLINKKNTPKKTIRFRKSYLFYAAAVFLGILFTTITYLNFQKNQSGFQTSDQFVRINISGEYQKLNDSDTINLKNSKGVIIGKQIGNKIVYSLKEDIAKKASINTIEVPYGKKFNLELSDGTSIMLNSGTVITYPEFFTKNIARRVKIVGEAFFDVAHSDRNPFIVEAADLNVKVLGTSFNVSAYPEDETSNVVLVRGSVGMYKDNVRLEDQNILKPGHKGTYDKADGSITKEMVETNLYTSWREDKLVFRNMSFENMLKKLERQFGYEIENKNEDLSNQNFNANFGNQPLNQILESFKRIYGIEYNIIDNKVIIK